METRHLGEVKYSFMSVSIETWTYWQIYDCSTLYNKRITSIPYPNSFPCGHHIPCQGKLLTERTTQESGFKKTPLLRNMLYYYRNNHIIIRPIYYKVIRASFPFSELTQC